MLGENMDERGIKSTFASLSSAESSESVIYFLREGLDFAISSKDLVHSVESGQVQDIHAVKGTWNHSLPQRLTFLIDNVLLKWSHELSAHDRATYLFPYFTGYFNGRRLPRESCASNVATSILILTKRFTKDAHSFLLKVILELLESIFSSWTVIDILSCADEDQQWPDLVQVISTLPDRVSNIMMNHALEFFNSENFFLKIGLDLGLAIQLMALMPAASQLDSDLVLLSQLVAKLCRLGRASTLLRGMYPVLFANIENLGTQRIWSKILKELPLLELERFLDALVRRSTPTSSNPSTASLNRQSTFLHLCLKQSLDNPNIPYIFVSKFLLNRTYSLPTLKMLIQASELISEGELSLPKVFEAILAAWTNSLFIKHASPSQQEYLTQALLFSLPRSNIEYLVSSDIMSIFLRGVQLYLESQVRETKLLGMVLAEEWSRITARSGADGEKIGRLNFEIKRNAQLDGLRLLARAETALEDPAENEEVEMVVVKGLKDLSLQKPITEINETAGRIKTTADSDDDSDEDEFMSYAIHDSESDALPPAELGKKQIRPPSYIYDCISYLTSSDDVDKMELALTHLVKIVTSANEKEMDDYAFQLLRVLTHLSDTYDLEVFSERTEAMVLLTTRKPKELAPYLAELFYDRNFNFAQRVEVLNILAASVQKLSQVIAPTPNKNPSVSTSKSKPKDASTTAADFITARIESNTTRFSTKSSVETSRPRPTKNRLATCAGDFFFPLVRGFGTNTHIDKMLTVDDAASMLVEKLIVTISVIVYASVGSSQMVSLCKEFWAFLWSLRYFSSTPTPASRRERSRRSPGVVTEDNIRLPSTALPRDSIPTSAPISENPMKPPETNIRYALLFGFVVILEASPPWLLKTEMTDAVSDLRDWIAEILAMETWIENRKLCMVVVGRLEELREEIGREWFGESWTG